MSTAEENIFDLVNHLDTPTLRRLYDHAASALARKDLGEGPRRQSQASACQAALFTVPTDIRYLDDEELTRLTQAFIVWRDAGRTPSIRRARDRMRLVYVMLR